MQTLSPYSHYFSNDDGAIPVKYLYDTQAAGGNKTTIAAVTGKRIKVLSMVAQTTTGSRGTLEFYSANTGGTKLYSFTKAANTENPFTLPENSMGYFETNTGEALIAAAVTNDQSWLISYIIYTPGG